MEREHIRVEGTTSKGRVVFIEAGGVVRMGDLGNGGTSSIGPRCELEDSQGRNKDAPREVSEDLVLRDFLGFFSSSCAPLVLAVSVFTLSPV